MKIPLNWLKDYVKTDASPRQIAASFTQLGLMLDKPIDSSGVIDLEHRMDRSDWLSIIGCARDYAAFSRLKLKYPKTNQKKLPQVKPTEMIEITVNTPSVRRFNTRIVKNVKVKQSPAWLKTRLEAYGIKSINNVVDITNYVMVEYGQPMHAQDTSQLKKREITLRSAKKGETVKTILGSVVTLDPSIFVLSSGAVATVIGGIVGGSDTSVTNKTTELILDAGNYDQAVIRKNSRKLKILNETVSRYDKFLHPDLCEIALDRATYLLETLAGGTVYHNFDYYPKPLKSRTQKLTYQRLKTLSGMDIPETAVKRILTALEYRLTNSTKDGLTMTVPYFRTDVEVEDDVIADILRINDYTNIPTLPLSTPVPPDITPKLLKFENQLRDLLVSSGAHEHITTSLVRSTGESGEILLSNALSSDQNALRTSHVPKLSEVLTNYHKHHLPSPVLFEIGLVFTQDKKSVTREHRTLTLVSGESISHILSTLLTSLGIDYQIDNNHKIIVAKQVVGALSHSFASLDISLLHPSARSYYGVKSDYDHTLSRDLSLLVPSNSTYHDITRVVSEINPTLRVSVKSTAIIKDMTNYLISLTFDQADSDRINETISRINQSLKTKLGIISKS